MNHKKITVIIFSLVLMFGLVACSAQPAAPAVEAAITLSDGLGREVTLAQPAQTIVSLAASNTEILYAIGAGDLLIGRDDFSDYPVEVLDVESIGGGMGDYNIESITALQPDLVLAAEINAPEVIDALEKLDIPVYYLANPVDFAGLYENLETVGILSGHQEEAQTLSSSLAERVEQVRSQVEQSESTPKIFFELDATEPAKPWTSGGGTFVNYLITMAGAENIASNVENDWVQYSQEDLIVQNPDIIILADAKWGTTADMVKERPGWDTISAVSNDAIFAIDDDLTSRPGPRLVDGLEELVKLCHPELVTND